MMKPLVSILIPAYNSELWLASSIKSALLQTWPNKEIIVVDDGSTDDTLRIAQSFEREGVKVFTQPNQGAAATRNKAYSLSQGDYIQWLDADDLLASDKIGLQLGALNTDSDRLLLSCEWGRFIYRPAKAKFVPSPLWADLAPAEWLKLKLGRNAFMQTGTWLVSRYLSEAAGPWDTQLLGDDDGEYFCRVLLASHGVRFVHGARVYYRMAGAASLSYIGDSRRKLEAQLRSMELHIRYLLSIRDDKETRTACVTYLQNWLPIFYPKHMDLVERMHSLATTLDGNLVSPELSWKYRWIQACFGLATAGKAKIFWPRFKWKMISHMDRVFSLVPSSQIIP